MEATALNTCLNPKLKTHDKVPPQTTHFMHLYANELLGKPLCNAVETPKTMWFYAVFQDIVIYLGYFGIPFLDQHYSQLEPFGQRLVPVAAEPGPMSCDPPFRC